jgi:hypothetical protein
MKLDHTNSQPAESNKKPKPKALPPKYQGNRFSSLLLLALTVLLSLAFYASGQ